MMMQSCSCQSGDSLELRLDNGKVIQVQRLGQTFVEFKAMGMPPHAMVADMLAERIKPIRPLAEPERPLYKQALLREYVRFLQAEAGQQDAVRPGPANPAGWSTEGRRSNGGAPIDQGQESDDSQPPGDATRAPGTVEIFSKPTCPYTRGLKRKLDHDRVKYVEYDVESDPAMLRLMLTLNGGLRHVPTVRQGDQITIGFHGH